MRKRIGFTLIIVSVIMAVVACQPDNWWEDYWWPDKMPEKPGAPGSEGNPYKISSQEDLENLRNIDTTGIFYELSGDIVLADEFEPIPVFKGTIDGNGYSIRGLSTTEYDSFDEYVAGGGYVMDDTRTFSAFIQSLDGGTIRNLKFEDYHISAPPASTNGNHRYMAVVAGVLSNGATLENITVGKGELVSPVRAGGIVSYVKNTDGSVAVNTVASCTNEADVTTEIRTNTYGTAGGIVSTTTDGPLYISDCRNSGIITGYVAGGIAGDIQNSRVAGETADGLAINGVLISEAVNKGVVRGVEYAGGILGNFWNGAAGDIHSSHNEATVECYIPEGINAPNKKITNLGGIIGSSITINEADKRTTHIIKDCTNTGDVVNNESAVDAYIGGIIGSTVFGHVIIDDCHMTKGTLKTVQGPKTTTAEPVAEVSIGGVIGRTEGNQIVIRNSYASSSVVYDVPSGYRYGAIAGYFGSASFGVAPGYKLDDGTTADWQDPEDIEKMMNEVIFDSPVTIANPFGILSATSYSKALRATNIRADKLYIGGASNYVADESTQDWVAGKTEYDLSGCVINELHRDLDFGSRGGGSKQTSVISGVDINALIIDEDTGNPPEYAPISIFFEIDDSFSFTNNATENFKLNINGTEYIGTSGSIEI